MKGMGRLSDAEALLREAASKKDGPAEVHFELSEILKATGRTEEAESELAKGRTLHSAGE